MASNLNIQIESQLSILSFQNISYLNKKQIELIWHELNAKKGELIGEYSTKQNI